MCNLLSCASQRIEAEKHQALFVDLAVQAEGRRQPGALQIGQTTPFKNKLRRAPSERNSQHANGLCALEARLVLQIYDRFSVRGQPWHHRLLFAADQEFRRSLLGGLPEKVECAVAVRAEDYLLAVGCPGPGQILPFVQGQESRRLQFGSVGFKSGNIDIRLPALFYIGQPSPIGRTAEILDLSRTSCKSRGCARWLSCVRIDFHRPSVRIVLVGRRFVQYIDKVVVSPCKRWSKARLGHDYLPFIARDVQNFNLRLYPVLAVAIHASQERDLLAIGGPDRGSKKIADLARDLPGLLAIRAHQPEFLALCGSFEKDNL